MKYLQSALSIAFLFSATETARAEFKLTFPLACELGTNCWVQQLPDHDASKDASDFTCGSLSYDGHDGTDIRVRDTSSTADVLAAADGIVKASRDGMLDHLIGESTKPVANRECGNGVVIAHADGFETQYCHMKKGSIAVKPNQKVKAGTKLGLVGYSGAAAFPHLHLSVRKNGVKIDPFAGPVSDDCLSTDQSLWATPIPYEDTSIIGFGFTEKPFALSDLESGKIKPTDPRETWNSFVGYAWIINLKKNDVVTLSFKTPSGVPAINTITMDRNKAQYMLIAGKKKAAKSWPKGKYEMLLEIQNDSAVRLTKSAKFELK